MPVKCFPGKALNKRKKILDKAANAVINEDNRQYTQRIEFLRKGLEHAQKEAKLAAIFNDKGTSEKEWQKALQELVQFRHETEHMHIANFAYSAANDITGWGDRFNLEDNN